MLKTPKTKKIITKNTQVKQFHVQNMWGYTDQNYIICRPEKNSQKSNYELKLTLLNIPTNKNL